MLAFQMAWALSKIASEERRDCYVTLEQLIEAGFKPETAIKLINSNLVLNAKKQTSPP